MIHLTDLKRKICSPFYYTPKIHREGNPGRPVINSTTYHTSKVSRFVDYHFQSLVKEVSSNINDPTDFVIKINNFKVPENPFLVTMNINFVFSYHGCKSFIYIHTKQRIYCCCQTKARQPRKENRSRKSDNILSTYFDTKQYHFLTQSFTFKSKAVLWEQNAPPIHRSSSYLRFIDDIFMVWTKLENQLKFFINEMSKKHSIKLDFKFSKETKIEFLDTLVDRLQTILYKKLTTSSFTKKEYLLQPSIKNKTSLLNF